MEKLKPKCPKCGKEIEGFYWSENAVRFGNYNIESGYTVDSVESNGNDEFQCPECDEVLFKDEDSAKKFLKCE